MFSDDNQYQYKHYVEKEYLFKFVQDFLEKTDLKELQELSLSEEVLDKLLSNFMTKNGSVDFLLVQKLWAIRKQDPTITQVGAFFKQAIVKNKIEFCKTYLKQLNMPYYEAFRGDVHAHLELIFEKENKLALEKATESKIEQDKSTPVLKKEEVVFKAAEIFKQLKIWQDEDDRQHYGNYEDNDAYFKDLFSFACKKNWPELIDTFIATYKYKFSLRALNEDVLIETQSPVLFALENGYDALVVKLINSEAVASPLSLLSPAVNKKNKKIAEFLLKKIYSHKEPTFINTILEEIFAYPNDQLSIKLQTLNASKIESRKTLLRTAIAVNNTFITEFFIENIDRFEWTPVFFNEILEQLMNRVPPAWNLIQCLVKRMPTIDEQSISLFTRLLNSDLGEHLPFILELLDSNLSYIYEGSDDAKHKQALKNIVEQKKSELSLDKAMELLEQLANKNDASAVFQAAEFFKKCKVWAKKNVNNGEYKSEYEAGRAETVTYINFLFELACKKNLPGLMQSLDKTYNQSYSKLFDVKTLNETILIEGKSPLWFALENRYDDLFIKLIDADYSVDKKSLLSAAITMKNETVATYLIGRMYFFSNESDFFNKAFKQILTPPPAWAIFDTLLTKATRDINAESIRIFIDSLNNDMGEERFKGMRDLIDAKLTLLHQTQKTELEWAFEQKKKTLLESKQVMGQENPQPTITYARHLLKKEDSITVPDVTIHVHRPDNTS